VRLILPFGLYSQGVRGSRLGIEKNHKQMILGVANTGVKSSGPVNSLLTRHYIETPLESNYSSGGG